MIYDKIIRATFISRPNRFIAEVEIEGRLERVHVKNTGRCKELLIPGATVILEDCSHNKTRKTRYSLIAVYKGDMLVNMDSQVPNKVIFDALENGELEGLTKISKLKREVSYKNSRFDIYFEEEGVPSFLEVKGVTLFDGELAEFPDAPTDRGRKHIMELIQAKENGLNAYLVFLVQTRGPKVFSPNYLTDPKFSNALSEADAKGVKIMVYDSLVTENSISIGSRLGVEI